jgi:peptidoglycan hydrolase-like protein with peptidoglycan-binding domain
MELKEGDSGSAVKEVQELLVKKGFDPGPADGVFGSKTKAAVIKFQQANKLVADGIVGAKTIRRPSSSRMCASTMTPPRILIKKLQ